MSRILVLATAFASIGALAQPAPAPAAPTAPAQPTGAPTTVAPAPAAPAAPAAQIDTDVFVATLDLAAGRVGAPRNVSARPGYDNQPAFLADGRGLLFVMELAPGNNEVFRHDLASGANVALTTTAEPEFSPTPLADGSGFTAVRVMQPAAEGEAYTESQQLWRYGMDGKPVAPVHPDWKRVGYHAWIDGGRLALFLVGGGPAKLPHSLVLASVADGKQTLLARDIGRSLARSPDGRVTFVDRSIPGAWSIATVMPGDLKPTALAATPKVAGEQEGERSQDFCWLPDGTLLMARGNRLLRFDPKLPGAGWTTLAELADLPGDIGRVAASRDGKHVAFVVTVRSPRTRGIRG